MDTDQLKWAKRYHANRVADIELYQMSLSTKSKRRSKPVRNFKQHRRAGQVSIRAIHRYFKDQLKNFSNFVSKVQKSRGKFKHSK